MSPNEPTNRLERAIERIDACNREDPHTIVDHGVERPWELVHSEAMTRWVEALDPDPSEELRIAARAQHIRRWRIPRDAYPKGKRGYHRWRNDLKDFHAELTGRIMAEAGYGPEAVEKAQRLNRKEGLTRADADPDVQTIEDALALTFLEYRLAPFYQRGEHADEKIVDILKRTMRKMSAAGIERAKTLALPADVGPLVQRAVDQLERDGG